MEMKGISREFFDALNAQFWHGNVRELLNVLEHSLASAVQDATLVPKHMPHQYRTNLLMSHSDIQKEMPEFSSPLNPDQDLPPLKEYRKEMEREYLHLLLDRAKGNRKKACALSGISQSQLYTLLKKHHLPGFKS